MTLLGDFLIQRALRRAAFAALVDRRRSRAHPSRGRFTHADVAEMLPVVWRFADAQPADTAGRTARIAATLRVAAIARAFLDALILREVEREYAVELVADVVWRLEKRWAELGALAMRSEPQWPATHESVPRPPPFAFCPAASITAPRGRTGELAVTHCPVAEHLHAHDADDLCRAVFCDAVPAIGERSGLKLTRDRTIAEGAAACELRWSRG
jgi:hypothetical protein